MLTPSQAENENKPNSSIRIITPPTDLRSMVDRVARFVASVQPWYEKSIPADKPELRKYSFLYDGDPYYPYYKQQVSELRAQNVSAVAHADDKTIDPLGLRDLVRSRRERMRDIQEWYKRFGESVAAAAAVTVVSPVTGELVQANMMYQHMEICVTDPKLKEQKERLFAKIRETAPTAQDDEISTSIVRLAERRRDVFGSTEEEFLNAVKTQIKFIQPLDLDGPVPEDLPLLPPPCNTQPRMKRSMGQSMSVDPPPPVSDPKRQRLPDSLLVPEDQFLAQHPGPVCIGVWVPETGQKLEIRVESLCESVSSLKEKIAGMVEVPANKQKLSGKVASFKDNLSLAYYNLAGPEMLSLSW